MVGGSDDKIVSKILVGYHLISYMPVGLLPATTVDNGINTSQFHPLICPHQVGFFIVVQNGQAINSISLGFSSSIDL